MFLSTRDIQLGRGEPIKDTARVLGRMIHGAVIRTYGQDEVVEFAQYSKLPTINALTDQEHPCQILADLLTLERKYGVGAWKDMKIAFLGDVDNNMGRSWMWAAKHLGFTLALAGPEHALPKADTLAALNYAGLICTTDAEQAVRGATIINTDTWISMGQEAEKGTKEKAFSPTKLMQSCCNLPTPATVYSTACLLTEVMRLQMTCWNPTPRSSLPRRRTACTRKKQYFTP